MVPQTWVTVRSLRAKDAVDCVWWLSKTPEPQADNTRVVTEYTPAMKRLLETKRYNRGSRPSGHVMREGFTADRGGAIPPNLLAISNTGNDKEYMVGCQNAGLKPHPARFPEDLPRFFIEMLTSPGDLVLDPFAGSNTTGKVAEALGERWAAVNLEEGTSGAGLSASTISSVGAGSRRRARRPLERAPTFRRPSIAPVRRPGRSPAGTVSSDL